MKRTEDSLRDLWEIIEVPKEEKKKGYQKNFEELIVEIFPKMEKEIVNQVQVKSNSCLENPMDGGAW